MSERLVGMGGPRDAYLAETIVSQWADALAHDDVESWTAVYFLLEGMRAGLREALYPGPADASLELLQEVASVRIESASRLPREVMAALKKAGILS